MTFPDAEFAETPVQIACPCPGFLHESKKYEFDRVFLPTATQEIVFEETKPLITSCADGYNVAIITYGQTGAGKTHTLMGSKACPGLNPRAMDELLRVCQERTQIDYALNVSLIEIYCNTLVDLLSDESVGDQKCAVQGGKLHGLVTHTITSAAEIAGVLEKGSRNRQVAATAMNSESSRSHMMLCLEVSSTDRITGHKSTGKLTLVDLAGSERLDKTFDATTKNPEERLKEAKSINTSLATLGQVFVNLRAGSKHIPYRNSKLTECLQELISGDSKVAFFVNVSPDKSNLVESVSTMNFGKNLGAIVKSVSSSNKKK